MSRRSLPPTCPPGSRVRVSPRREPRSHPRGFIRIGYFLSTEEYGPSDLFAKARAAEQASFEALWISAHFHPRNDDQGTTPFVWSVLEAISEAFDLPVTT